MNQLRKVGAIATMNLRRFVRERTNLFFSFVLPIALILVVGLSFGSDPGPRLGVSGPRGETARAVLELLTDDGIEIVLVDDPSTLADRVESTDLDAAVEFPDDLDETVASGEEIRVVLHAGNSNAAARLRASVQDGLDRVVAVPDALRRAVEAGADPVEAQTAAEHHSDVVGRIGVRTVTTGERLFPEDLEGMTVGAPSQLVLFVFLTGLTGSSALILTRKLGLGTRMMTSPTPVATIIGGEALGRFVIALVQGLYVMIATMVLFDVSWGAPAAAVMVVVAVAAVSAGAAMCFGSFFSNPDSASGLGVVVALCLAALGGAMLPIELFGDSLLATAARFTPHYWALDAFALLLRHDGSLGDILGQLGVLMAMSIGLLGLASWRLRNVLTGSGRA